jgi:UDP-glucose:(glucosyl)LPS alpha-1,2-glucosyltransferase
VSVIYKGEIIDSNLTRNAKGGTEQMRARLVNNVNGDLLKNVAIHFSRPETLYNDVPNILYCHDLANDPAVACLHTNKDDFAAFVFVSYWQRDQFISKFNLPYSKCFVIENAIETEHQRYEKPKDVINFIYHTTPHRGLGLAVPIFEKLCEEFDNIHFNVFSSFEVYGWKERDKPYESLFKIIEQHPKMTYHGAQSNDAVIEALKQSHIFLYPCIWQETSCIALIEAMICGVLPIYPSFGALHETGKCASNTGMYDYKEDHNENASLSYNIARGVLQNINKFPNFVESAMAIPPSNSYRHSINAFASRWNNLLLKSG